ncbi:uncharacterized protein LOC142317817 [Lycorma delicatula]|uniref:uncharacterized protein LOC142317817 n=1 Tax=Lycorma delicatula TaxID=130591 RepID=UPI003F518CC7
MSNTIYDVEEWTEDFIKTIMMPKKIGTNKREEHRTISLISHATKIMLGIINRRLNTKMEENAGEEQFGFRKRKGTKEAVGIFRMIEERCFERGRGLSLCFIGMNKAFDIAQLEKLFEILKENRVD